MLHCGQGFEFGLDFLIAETSNPPAVVPGSGEAIVHLDGDEMLLAVGCLDGSESASDDGMAIGMDFHAVAGTKVVIEGWEVFLPATFGFLFIHVMC